MSTVFLRYATTYLLFQCSTKWCQHFTSIMGLLWMNWLRMLHETDVSGILAVRNNISTISTSYPTMQILYFNCGFLGMKLLRMLHETDVHGDMDVNGILAITNHMNFDLYWRNIRRHTKWVSRVFLRYAMIYILFQSCRNIQLCTAFLWFPRI